MSEEKKADKAMKKEIKKTLRDYRKNRYWIKPNKRAKTYAEELKARVHNHGDKEGEPLSPTEKGIRMGYLQNQSDQAGLYKYKKARNEGKSLDEAAKESWKIGK